MRRCLGDRVADLVDGRLDASATARAYAHVAECRRCRAAVAAEREASARLRGSSGGVPTQDFLDRLGSIAGDGVAPRPVPPIPVQAGADRPWGRGPSGPAGVRPVGVPGQSRRRRQGRVVIASAAGAAALAVVAVVGGGSASLGGTAVPAPAIAPVVDTFTVEHAASTDQLPLSGPRIVTLSDHGPSTSASPSP